MKTATRKQQLNRTRNRKWEVRHRSRRHLERNPGQGFGKYILPKGMYSLGLPVPAGVWRRFVRSTAWRQAELRQTRLEKTKNLTIRNYQSRHHAAAN